MSQFWSLCFVALVFVAYEGVFVDAVCPATKVEAEAASKECLRRVGLDIDEAGSGGSLAKKDLDQLRQYCSDGTLDRALGCVQEIIDDCKQKNDALGDALEKAISVSKLRSGFKFMCDNLQVVIDNSQCISEQQGAVATCVQAETKRLQTELQAQQARGERPEESDIWRITCGFMDRLFACQHKIYLEQCGKDIADVMTTFMQSAKPPVCAEYSGARALSVSWTLLAGLFSLYLYLRE